MTTETTEMEYLNLPDFDMNTVDLLQAANFDYLLDMFGQQYPSF